MSESQHSLLRKYGIRPVKKRGQNFLVDGNLARAIARETLDVGDRVLELGAGAGALTVHLLADAARVVCVKWTATSVLFCRRNSGSGKDFNSSKEIWPSWIGPLRWRQPVSSLSSPEICPTC